jgi:pyruvate-ferredoxin/flavodoxin oxidoreductase
MEIPMTFADFAMTEARFRKHFRMAPPDAWHEDMVPLAEFMELEQADREGKYPYIWSVDKRQHLTRLLVDEIMVKSSEERRDFWIMLKAIAGVVPPESVTPGDLEAQVRRDVVGKIASGLMKLADGGNVDLAAGAADLLNETPAPGAAPEEDATAGGEGGYMAPWIDTDDCTACDECTNLNPAMFAYNDAKKAYIKDPLAGPYRDLVKAAEKCTAQVIHPGMPKDMGEKDIDKWIARGEKFN